jgi:DNA-binding CsgD family transcriptional regulator
MNTIIEVPIYTPPVAGMIPEVASVYDGFHFSNGLTDDLVIADARLVAVAAEGEGESAVAVHVYNQRPRNNLTALQRQRLSLVSAGVSPELISQQEGVTETSVTNGLAVLYENLGVSGASHAIRKLHQMGELPSLELTNPQLMGLMCLTDAQAEEFQLASLGIRTHEATALSGRSVPQINYARREIRRKLRVGRMSHAVGLACSVGYFNNQVDNFPLLCSSSL